MTERMWRVVALFRVITMSYAAVLIIRDHDQYRHPAGGIAVLAVIIGWTGITVTAYSRPAGRQRWLIVADVAVAVAVVLSTRLIDTASRIHAGMPTLPSFWAASPVLACAVAGGPWAGFAAGAAISAADLAERPDLSSASPLSNILLLLIAGGVGGYIVRLGIEAEQAVDRVARAEAVIAERDRIARGIHDSVLQVLALVSRRGQELGGEAAELGRLAAEQELVLRRLVTGGWAGSAGAAITEAIAGSSAGGGAAEGGAAEGGAASSPGRTGWNDGGSGAMVTGGGGGLGEMDLREAIEQFSDPVVTVSCPATAVLLPAAAGRALSEATAAALDNTRRHAGAGACAYVLVEDEGPLVRVSIRDDGAGFSPGRLAEAAAAGRLGVTGDGSGWRPQLRRPPGPRGYVRARPDGPGDRDPAAGGQGPDVSADRGAADAVDQNGAEPCPEHPDQAPAAQQGRARPVRPGTGPARLRGMRAGPGRRRRRSARGPRDG
jgi:signal transduction histidine kinase